MGTGCESVSRVQTKDTDVASLPASWKDGRVARLPGHSREGKSDYGMVVFGGKGIGNGDGQDQRHLRSRLLSEIIKYFPNGGPPPVKQL